ncbi:MAG: RES family NAD+ phosphorylase [Aquabacterium sp.]
MPEPDVAALMASAIEVPWQPSYRLVHSRFPPVSIFEACESAEELEIIALIQGLTKERILQEQGALQRVPPEDQLFGHGTTPVMAAFCYVGTTPTRFSNGAYGVYYAANSLEVAVAEVTHHIERFMQATRPPAEPITLRCYSAQTQRPVVDIRGPAWTAAHKPDDYTAAQSLAQPLREAGAWGLLYRSVRAPGGECVALLRPPAVKTPVVQHCHVNLNWDGERIRTWYRIGALKTL